MARSFGANPLNDAEIPVYPQSPQAVDKVVPQQCFVAHKGFVGGM